MNKEIITGTIGTTISFVGTATQTNEILQSISLIITIVGALITYIIMPLLMWYFKAKKDGKITKEEIKKGMEIAKEGTEKIQEKINKEEEK